MARRSLATVSTNELQSELRRRVRERDKLLQKRDRLIDQIEAIDRELDGMGVDLVDAPGAGRRGGGKRPRNELNLVDALHGVLKNKQMGVTELAEAVQKAGYKTTSPNFRTIVNQALINNPDRFKRVQRGLYTTK